MRRAGVDHNIQTYSLRYLLLLLRKTTNDGNAIHDTYHLLGLITNSSTDANPLFKDLTR